MPTDDANPWDDPDASAPEPAATGPEEAPAEPTPATASEVVAPAGAPAAAPPADDGDGGEDDAEDRRRVLVIAAVAFVVIAVVGFVLTRGGDEGDDAATPTTAPQAQASDDGASGGGSVVIGGTADPFDRDDTDDGLGALPSGAPWIIQSGTWAIRDGEAVVAQPEDQKRNTAIVATGYPDPQAQVKLTTVANGAGMVFRYQGECNFWAVYAVPQYATWNVEKVVDCERVGEEEGSPVFRTITSAPVADGTVVGVVLSGEQVQIVLNGRIALTFDDPDLAGVGRVGLTTRGEDAAAFDDFVGGGPGGQGIVGAATPPAEGGGSTTTAAGGGDGGDAGG